MVDTKSVKQLCSEGLKSWRKRYDLLCEADVVDCPVCDSIECVDCPIYEEGIGCTLRDQMSSILIRLNGLRTKTALLVEKIVARHKAHGIVVEA